MSPSCPRPQSARAARPRLRRRLHLEELEARNLLSAGGPAEHLAVPFARPASTSYVAGQGYTPQQIEQIVA